MINQQRIASKVFLTDTGCWNWTGYVCPREGYGYLSVKDRNTKANRASYVAFKGEIEGGLMVCHSCDNRMCVNPDHLFLGTAKDNIGDCVRKGRNARGERQHLAKLNEDSVRSIREDGESTREELVKRYRVSKSAIAAVITRRTWKHI